MLSRFQGCLIAGALGDALGWPIEFTKSSRDIANRFGTAPPERLPYATRSPAEITDDTQMTLFVAEGVIRALQRGANGGDSIAEVTQHALLRWYQTQRPNAELSRPSEPGWLFSERRLHARRAPGNTCLASLAAQAKEWHTPTVHAPPNDSKGCGAIMRAAPLGLAARTRQQAFDWARDTSVLTHGHPSGYLSAAAFASIVFDVARDVSLTEAIANSESLLRTQPDAEETLTSIAAATRAAERGAPSATDIESLGGGWVGEEALAIALACTLTAGPPGPDSMKEALWRAAAHAGDSDSTASMTGNLLGAMWGDEALPLQWTSELELHDIVHQVAVDLHAVAILGMSLDFDRYPPT